MVHLDNRRINFVKGLPLEVRAKVLYEYLKKGTSNREIEKRLKELSEEDGWQAWSVIHFYGFNGSHKTQYNTTLKAISEQIQFLNDDEIVMLHLDEDSNKAEDNAIEMNENDGKDIFRLSKHRVGQNKLRKKILKNYKSKCAICNINDPKHLITSHICTWAESVKQDRVNPTNAILLCKLHDSMFENGMIGLNDSYDVVYLHNYDFTSQGIVTNLNFTRPIVEPPSLNFLEKHRQRFGL